MHEGEALQHRGRFLPARYLPVIGVALSLANYLFYLIGTVQYGGDLLHAQAVTGGYLSDTGHGLIVLTRSAYLLGICQLYSLLATFPLGLWCAWKVSNNAWNWFEGGEPPILSCEVFKERGAEWHPRSPCSV